MASETLNWARFFDIGTPWVHFVIGSENTIDDFVCTMPQKSEAVARIIRGTRCRTTTGLFQEWASALQFPYYFGENWDAFEECLLDLEWLPAKAYIFFITNANFLLQNSESEFQKFMDILSAAATTWRNTTGKPGDEGQAARPFHIVLHCELAVEATMRSRLSHTRVKLT